MCQSGGGKDDRRLAACRRIRIRARPKAFRVHAGTPNQVGASGDDQASPFELPQVVWILEDDPAVGMTEEAPIEAIHDGPEGTGLPTSAGVDLAKPRQGINDGMNAADPCRNAPIQYTLDGEIVNGVRPLGAEDPDESRDCLHLP